MLAAQDLWKLIEPVVQAEGLELYDIEFGGDGRGGLLRVTLWKGEPSRAAASEGAESSTPSEAGVTLPSEAGVTLPSEAGVTLPSEAGVAISECSKVSRKISALDRFEEVFPSNTTLEVSSPGVNRRLRRKEHFLWAVGERVKLRVLMEGEEQSFLGVIKEVDDQDQLHLQLEKKNEKGKGKQKKHSDTEGEEFVFPLADIVKGKVDFAF